MLDFNQRLAFKVANFSSSQIESFILLGIFLLTFFGIFFIVDIFQLFWFEKLCFHSYLIDSTFLFEAIDYIVDLEKEKDNHEKELDSLKKEIMALRIMKS
jgi:hypothetical protein